MNVKQTLRILWPLVLLYVLIATNAFSQNPEQSVAEIRIAIPYTPGPLDPLALDEPLTRVILENLAIGLTERTNTTATLAFATGMTVRDGGTRWIFELPANGTFVSGRTVSAKEIKKAYDFYREKLRSPTNVGSLTWLRERAANIREVIAIDPVSETAENQARFIQFVLDKPDLRFAESVPTLGIIEMEVQQVFGESFGIGTQYSAAGPYRIRENRDGQVLLEMVGLERDASLLRGQLIFRQFASAEQALRNMRNGEIDLILFPTPTLLKETAEDPAIGRVASPCIELAKLSGPWHPMVTSWGSNSDENTLLFDSILVRKSLTLDARIQARFAFSACTPGCAPVEAEAVPLPKAAAVGSK